MRINKAITTIKNLSRGQTDPMPSVLITIKKGLF